MPIEQTEKIERQMPLVSIIAVCYNHQTYVIEALESIINQTYKEIELIIIDSNSTDDSSVLIQRWIDEKKIDCVFIQQNTNKNVCQNLNLGMQYVHGDFYQGISCDDVLMPNKIEAQVKYLKENPNISIAHSSAIKIDEHGEIIDYEFVLDRDLLSMQIGQSDLLKRMVFASRIVAPSVLIRKSHLPPAPVYNESYIIEDLYLYLRMLVQGRQIYFLNQPLVKYRVLSTSVMRSEKLKSRLQHDRVEILKSFKGQSRELDKHISIYLSQKMSFGELVSIFVKGQLPWQGMWLKIKRIIRLQLSHLVLLINIIFVISIW